MNTCTVIVSATGERCGARAVETFTGRSGESFGECAAHAPGNAPARESSEVGESVAVNRHGKTYTGRITRVTRNGNRFAEVTYGNGVRREVRI